MWLFMFVHFCMHILTNIKLKNHKLRQELSVSYGILCHYGNFWMTPLMNSLQIVSWIMDEFIHWPKPHPLLSATCDEILAWTIEIGMKNHLVSDSNCNTINL